MKNLLTSRNELSLPLKKEEEPDRSSNVGSSHVGSSNLRRLTLRKHTMAESVLSSPSLARLLPPSANTSPCSARDLELSPQALERGEGNHQTAQPDWRMLSRDTRMSSRLTSSGNFGGSNTFLENIFQGPDPLDPRLDLVALEKAQQKMLDALNESPEIRGGVNEELEAIMIYKGRPLKARLLHFAVWCSAKTHDCRMVTCILPYLDSSAVFAKAKYQTRAGCQLETWLDAMHIAAGLGFVPALDVLLRFVTQELSAKTEQDYVNTVCVVHHPACCRPNGRSFNEAYYTPLHDATHAGNKGVAMWLLEHKAEARAGNKDGVTPLHFVAMRGIEGGLEAEDELERLVRALRSRGASLDKKVPNSHPDERLRGKIPLQLAATDWSRFPKRMMHLLAPCLNNRNRFKPCFFSDISFLTTLNTDAADEIVCSLSDRVSKEPDVLQSFRYDAQMEGKTDVMAAIIFMAPLAGAEMLEMLIVDPEVQDVAKHNIPTRTSLHGIFSNPPMRCSYKPDVIKREGVKLPSWNFDVQRCFEDQPEIRWHKDFIPEWSGDVRSSSEDVCNVVVKTMLLPNMLDMDIIMALARIPCSNVSVFAKLAVQGMVYCLWDNLIIRVWYVNMGLHILELIAYIWWGLGSNRYIPDNALANAPGCWAVVTAGGLRELLNLIGMTFNWFRKYSCHEDLTMKCLWDPASEVCLGWVVPSLCVIICQLAFSWSARSMDDEDGGLSELSLLLMAANVLLKCSMIIYMSRLCTWGMRIHAMTNSLLGGATRQMLGITVGIFASFSLAFLVLARGKDVGWVLASSYRGLLFGDGVGFDNLGLDIDDEARYLNNDTTIMVLLIGGSSFFNIIILNLIIAVYGNEYDKVEKESPLLFLHSLSKYCVMYHLSCDLIQWQGHNFNRFLKLCVAVTYASGFLVYLLCPWRFGGPGIAAVLFAISQVTLEAALIQCDWFSTEGIAASQNEHFVWICHRQDFSENSLKESEHVARDALDKKIDALQDHLQEKINVVDGKLESFNAKLDTILSSMALLQQR
eukprot:TRINITY_DN18536_c0_g1_i1.p1 TRINITY_DN18536_c0_g1~~TRINITY_DN18536_c0_g1_i1.p1  ORF type:complete len:1029 (+),score=161.45 TRINITY_DN18536_c0_g1_i1:233-3319(+)